nr:STAS domain-containing protein [Actinoplanes solisilvae]
MPAGDRTALLICDRCGVEEAATAALPAAELVWPLVSGHGWTGSAFPTGPHHCPSCPAGDLPVKPESTSRPRTHGPSYLMRTDGGTAVLKPLTDLDAELTECLRDELMHAAATCPNVVVDLRSVGFIDSTALGLLVRARQEARQHDATFGLVEPSRFVRTVLHTMRLDSVFPIYPDWPEPSEEASGDPGATRPVRDW